MAFSASANFSSVSGNVWQGVQQRQAEQLAAQAEMRARALKNQASAAESEAQQAAERARSLNVESAQADQAAGQARQNLATRDSYQGFLQDMSNRLDGVVAKVAEKDVTPAAEPVVAAAATSAVVNSSGQATGLLVNVTA